MWRGDVIWSPTELSPEGLEFVKKCLELIEKRGTPKRVHQRGGQCTKYRYYWIVLTSCTLLADSLNLATVHFLNFPGYVNKCVL